MRRCDWSVDDPIADIGFADITFKMRRLSLIIGFAAAATLLFTLGAAVLIWSQSDLSYYLQFALALSLLCGLFCAARRSWGIWMLALLALASATITTAMPIESFSSRLSTLSSFGGFGISWTVQFALTAIFTFGMKFGFAQREGRDR